MDFFTGKRSGKTTELIKMAAKNNGVIIVRDDNARKNINYMVAQMDNLSGVVVVTAREIFYDNRILERFNEVYFDDVDLIINYMFGIGNRKTMFTTDSISDLIPCGGFVYELHDRNTPWNRVSNHSPYRMFPNFGRVDCSNIDTIGRLKEKYPNMFCNDTPNGQQDYVTDVLIKQMNAPIMNEPTIVDDSYLKLKKGDK